MTDPTPDQMAGMTVFARVVEANSFSGAARTLGSTKSAVSKQVARLEAQLGVQLLRRTTRRLSLTDAGQVFYDRATHAVALAREAQHAVLALTESPRGLLRVTAPLSFGRLRVVPLLPGFLRAYPDLRVQVVLLDRPVDLANEGFDLAIRLTRTLPADVIARKLAPIGYLLCAAAGYFTRATLPRVPEDLLRVNCLRYGEGETSARWHLEGPEGRRSVLADGNLRVNNSEALRAAMLDGLGVALLPDYVVADDLRARRAVRVLPAWAPRAPFGTSAYAVWLPDRHLPAKLRAFIDFLREHLDVPDPVPPRKT